MTIRTTTLVSSGQFARQPGKPVPLCQIILHFAVAQDDGCGSGDSQNCKTSFSQSTTSNVSTLSFIGQMPFLLTNNNVKALKMTITR